MEVTERRQYLEHVCDRLPGRKRIAQTAAGLTKRGQQLLETSTPDVFHHDVPGALVLDEVEDLDDVRVLDLRQKPSLGQSGRVRVRVARVEQPL